MDQKIAWPIDKTREERGIEYRSDDVSRWHYVAVVVCWVAIMVVF